MAESFTIIVHASAGGPGELTVRDAMQQVLDLVDLMEKAGNVESSSKVVWRLKSASTNSPFSVQAENSSSNPSVSTSFLAIHAKELLENFFHEITENKKIPNWMDQPSLRVAKRIFERNTNGIGLAEIDMEEGRPKIQIDNRLARSSCVVIDAALRKDQLESLAHTEFGSAEGDILAAATYYGRPSLMLRERLTGDRVTCVLSSDAAEKIGSQQSLQTVWNGQRVLVHGAIHYNEEGHITKIDAEDLERVFEVLVDLNEIRELDITSGNSPTDYLNHIRGIDLG